MKRKLLFTSAFVLALTSLFSQREVVQVNEPVDFKKSSISLDYNTSLSERTAACIDTINYVQAKEVLLGDYDPNTSSGNFYIVPLWGDDNEATSQTYYLSGTSVLVTGVEFVVRVSEDSDVANPEVQIGVYEVDASNNPTTLLGSQTATISSTSYAYHYVNFATPITVSSNYAIVLKSTTPNSIVDAYFNDLTPGQVYDENLSRIYTEWGGATSPGTWTSLSNSGLFTTPDLDGEPVLNPIVSYNVTSDFTASSSEVCIGTPVSFTNESSPASILSNRMFSFWNFANHFNLTAADSTNYWDMGDGSVYVGAGHSHTYANAGSYDVDLIIIGGFSETCLDVSSETIIVNDLDDATFSYPSNTLCLGGGAVVPTITGVSGGTFSVDNTDLVIDPTTGEIDIDDSQEGIYTVTYTTNDNCPNDESVTITVTSSPDASFTYDNTDYCSNEGTILPSFAPGASAGSFSSTTGLVFVDASTGEINLNASDAGVYTITNTIAASGSCPEISETFEITINEAPTVTIDNGDIEACIYHDAIELTATPAGGTFSGPGVTNNSFDPQTAGNGTHTITYTYEDSEGCENSATIQIEVDGCVGISTNELNNQVVLYPNPSTNYIDVALLGNHEMASVVVISLEGKIVNTPTKTVDNQTTRIDVSSLSVGTYLVQISTNNGTITKKIMVQ